MRSLISAVFALIAVLFSGCAQFLGGYSPEQAIHVAITNPFPSATVGTPSKVVTAVVQQNGGQAGVTWSLTVNGVNCSPTCGTLVPSPPPSLTAAYTPPAVVPQGAANTPTITATSVADTSKSASFTFSIRTLKGISVTLSGTFPFVFASDVAETITAEVENDNAGVQWTMTAAGGVPCTLACGTFLTAPAPSLEAIYTPPPNKSPAPYDTVTITATSVSDNSKSASFTFDIHEPVKFTYIFSLRGYDSAGMPLAMVGALVANPNGSITQGEMDINDAGNVTHIQPVQGKYETDTTFNGIIRAQLTIKNAVLPGTNINPTFRYVLRSNQIEGKIIELDGGGYLTAGTVQSQYGFDPSVPGGVYVFGLDSDAPVGRRTVENGAFEILGDSVQGVVDASQAGAAAPIANSPMTGIATPPDAFGRGTISFDIQGTTTQYAYYVVNGTRLNVYGSQLYLIQTGGGFDFGTVLAGTARGDGAYFDASTAPFGTSVVQMTGMDIPQGSNLPSTDVVIGAMTISQDNSVHLTFDSNDAGTVNTGATLTGTLSFYDPNTGRGVVSFPNGYTSGFVDTAVLYFFDTGEGFITDGDPTVNGGTRNKGFSGTLAQQHPAPFGLSGPLLALGGASSSPSIPNAEVALSADSASGTLSGVVCASSTEANPICDASIQGTFTTGDPATGHGTAMIPGGFFGNFTPNLLMPASVYYVVGNRLVLIGTQAGTPSGVLFVEPD